MKKVLYKYGIYNNNIYYTIYFDIPCSYKGLFLIGMWFVTRPGCVLVGNQVSIVDGTIFYV